MKVYLIIESNEIKNLVSRESDINSGNLICPEIEVANAVNRAIVYDNINLIDGMYEVATERETDDIIKLDIQRVDVKSNIYFEISSLIENSNEELEKTLKE